MQLTLIINGCKFKILLCAFKLASLNSFEIKKYLQKNLQLAAIQVMLGYIFVAMDQRSEVATAN